MLFLYFVISIKCSFYFNNLWIVCGEDLVVEVSKKLMSDGGKEAG
jgi:hypothetical protein